MSNVKPLKRQILSKFLPNHEAIRVFENLLQEVGTDIPSSLAALSLLIEELTINEGLSNAKSNQALATLSSIAKSLELLAATPPVPDQIQPDFIEVVRLREDVAVLAKKVDELQFSPPSVATLNQIVAGTGLSGGTITTSGTIAIANTIVAGGPTGAAATVPVITYNAQGQLTTVGTATITPAAIGAQSAAANLTTWAGIAPGANVGTALAVAVGTDGAFVVKGGALGTPSSGTVTNLTGTASININGTVGATSQNTGSFTGITLVGSAANQVQITGAVTTQHGIYADLEFQTSGHGMYLYGNSGGHTGSMLRVYQDSANAGADYAVWVHGDNSKLLRVEGAGAATYLNLTTSAFTLAGTVQFTSYGAGAITSDASGNLTAVSDETIKDKIEPYTAGLTEIVALSNAKATIRHHYRSDSGLDTEHEYAGFNANIVEKIFPHSVGRMRDSKFHLGGIPLQGHRTFSERPIVAGLVNAVAKLDSRLASAGL